MIYVKIGTMCLGLIGFGAWAWWGHAFGESRPIVTDVKTIVPGVSPEVRARAFALLDKVVAESRDLKRREDGLAIQFMLADLLWEKDETRARNLFTSIAAEAEKGRCECDFLDPGPIAARDAKLAIRILETSGPGPMQYGKDIIYQYLVKQYPDEALQRGKAAVANNTFLDYLDLTSAFGANSANTTRGGRLGTLYASNQSHGANLAKDILIKLRENQLYIPPPFPNYNTAANAVKPGIRLSNTPFSYNANMPARNYAYDRPVNATNALPNRMTANYWQSETPIYDGRIPFSAAAALLATASDSAAQSTKNGGPPMLTEAEIKTLASAMVKALIRAKRFELFPVRGVWADLKKYAPRDAARLEGLLTRSQRTELNSPINPFDLPFHDAGISNDLPVSANESPAEKDEREFINDARFNSQVACPRNPVHDADKFAALPNPDKYPDLVEFFAEFLPMAYAKAGKIEKVRPFLANEQNRLTKFAILSHAAAALGAKGDRETATKLIAEAGQLIPRDIRNREEFAAVEVYALALARVDPEKGFEMAEKLLDKGNHLLKLKSELADFSGSAGGESLPQFDFRRGQIATNSAQAILIIRALAGADFDRTVKMGDRFSESEQRVFFKWYIVNALLNKNAELEEKSFGRGYQPEWLCS